MNKILLVLIVISAIGCKKHGDDLPPIDTFTIGGSTYTATEYEPKNLYWGTGSGYGSGIWFVFGPTKPVAGTYRVGVGKDVIAVGRLRDGSGQVVADFQTTGSDNQTLTVSYDGGNMIINMPKVWAKYGSDSVQISGYVKEYL